MTSKAEFDAYVAGSLASLDRAQGATISTGTVHAIIAGLASRASEVFEASQPAAAEDSPAPAAPVASIGDADLAPDHIEPQTDPEEAQLPTGIDLHPIEQPAPVDPAVDQGTAPVADQPVDQPAASIENTAVVDTVVPAVPTSEPTDATAI